MITLIKKDLFNPERHLNLGEFHIVARTDDESEVTYEVLEDALVKRGLSDEYSRGSVFVLVDDIAYAPIPVTKVQRLKAKFDTENMSLETLIEYTKEVLVANSIASSELIEAAKVLKHAISRTDESVHMSMWSEIPDHNQAIINTGIVLYAVPEHLETMFAKIREIEETTHHLTELLTLSVDHRQSGI